MDAGGVLRAADRGGVRRELTVRPGPDGTPAYDYRENGVPKPFDAAAQRWLTQSLNDARAR